MSPERPAHQSILQWELKGPEDQLCICTSPSGGQHQHFQRGMSLPRKQEMDSNLVAVMSVFWLSTTAEELWVWVPDSLIQAESEVGRGSHISQAPLPCAI